eukprot:GHVT01083531.1.p1 GENE.GHVT01083531.1~~GHVT01083531.1.p1  ORF type:complete len:170 (+),score=34.61 GHVT01083531.1:111-620(+)
MEASIPPTDMHADARIDSHALPLCFALPFSFCIFFFPSVLRPRFSPGGNLLATSSADGSCSIWRFHGGSVARASTLEAHPDAWAWDCVFTQDGAYLLTGGSDCVCKLWEVQSGRAVLEYRGHRQVVSALALFDAPLEASAFPSYPGVREANDPRLIGGGQAALGPPIAS